MDEWVVALWATFWIILKQQMQNFGDRGWEDDGSSSNEACKVSSLLLLGCTITETRPNNSRPAIHSYTTWFWGAPEIHRKCIKYHSRQSRIACLYKKFLPNQLMLDLCTGWYLSFCKCFVLQLCLCSLPISNTSSVFDSHEDSGFNCILRLYLLLLVLNILSNNFVGYPFFFLSFFSNEWVVGI